MMADSPDINPVNEHFAGRSTSRDGLQEQMILLNRLSEKVDEYFALRSMENDETRK